MANTNSNLISNLESDPVVWNEVGLQGGRVRQATDQFEVAAADIDADGDTVNLVRLPSNARILSIKTFNDDLDTGATAAFNCGIYDVDGNIKDEDAFSSAVTFQAADTSGTEHRFEAADINTADQPLWELAGDADADSADAQYDIVLTQTAASAGAQAGTIAFQILYVID